jgi:hypothetical protein
VETWLMTEQPAVSTKLIKGHCASGKANSTAAQA